MKRFLLLNLFFLASTLLSFGQGSQAWIPNGPPNPQLNGVVYVDALGHSFSTPTSGGGTNCLLSVSGGAPAWGSCPTGAASTAFSSLTASAANNSFNLGNFTNTWTAGTATTAPLVLNDTTGNTGTNPLFQVNTVGTSTAQVVAFYAKGTANGVAMSNTGLLSPTGTGGINATQINGAAVPASGTVLASNGSSQITALTPSAAFNAIAPATSNGGLIVATGTNTYGNLPIGSTGNALIVSSGTAAWGNVPITSGGTGATTSSGAFNNLAPTASTGGLITYNGTTWTGLNGGSSGQILSMTGSTPGWIAAPSGGLASGGTVSGDLSISGATSADPWMDIKAYGAKGDLQVVNDGGMVNGSTSLTSASNRFVAGDVGKLVTVVGAGLPTPAITTASTSTTGGSILASSQVFYQVSCVGPNGESLPSTAASEGNITTGAGNNNTVTIPFPSCGGNATGWIPYMAYTSGYEEKQAGFLINPPTVSGITIAISSTGGSMTLSTASYAFAVTCTWGLAESASTFYGTVAATATTTGKVTITTPSAGQSICGTQGQAMNVYMSGASGTCTPNSDSTCTELNGSPIALVRGVKTTTVTSFPATGNVVPIGCTLNAASTGCSLSSNYTAVFVYTEMPKPPFKSVLITTIASVNNGGCNLPGCVVLAAANQNGTTVTSAATSWGTDNAPIINSTETTCEGLSGAANGTLYFPPGNYFLGSMITNGLCSWVGSTNVQGNFLYWGGFPGQTMVTKVNAGAGRIDHLAFRGEQGNKGTMNMVPGVILDIVDIPDAGFNMDNNQFTGAAIDIRMDQGWFNTQFIHNDVNNWTDWAIDIIIQQLQSGSDFQWSGGTFSQLTGPPLWNACGTFLIDASETQVGGAGTFRLSDFRDEQDQANGTGCIASSLSGNTGVSKAGFVTLRSNGGAGVGSRWLNLDLEDISYQGSSLSAAPNGPGGGPGPEYILGFDGGSSASFTQMFQVKNFKYVGGTTNLALCGGLGLISGCNFKPASDGTYSFVSQMGSTVNLMAITNIGLEIGTNATATNALGTHVFGDANDRLTIGPDGKHSWGPGSGVADTTLVRSAAGVLNMSTASSELEVSGAAVTPVYSCGTTTTCSNTAVTGSLTKILKGTVTLTTGAATVASISPAFVVANTFCFTQDTTTPANVSHAVAASTSSISVTGTGSDVIVYACIVN